MYNKILEKTSSLLPTSIDTLETQKILNDYHEFPIKFEDPNETDEDNISSHEKIMRDFSDFLMKVSHFVSIFKTRFELRSFVFQFFYIK